MRILLIPATLLALRGGTVVFAGVPSPHRADLAFSTPDPARSIFVVNEPGAACQFRVEGCGE